MRFESHRFLITLALLAGLPGYVQAAIPVNQNSVNLRQTGSSVAPEVANDAISSPEWAKDMAHFAELDATNPPPQHAVLFIGSSTIRKWTSLTHDFSGVDVINRGFGGSEVRDSTYYADRIVIPYKPREIVFYAGDNDLANGRSAQQVVNDVFSFIGRVRRDLPGVPIVFISIKPSPSRAQLLSKIRQANALISQRAAQLKDVRYVDVFTPMLTADGQLRPELFEHDMLHMNADGYALWTRLLTPYVAPKPN